MPENRQRDHRSRGRRDLRDELREGFSSYAPRDSLFPRDDPRAGVQGRARSRHTEQDFTFRQGERRHRSRPRQGRSRSRYPQHESTLRQDERRRRSYTHAYRGREQYEPTYSDNLTRADRRSRSRAAPRRSDYDPRTELPVRSRDVPRQSDYEQRTEFPIRSKASTTPTDYERDDRRNVSPPSARNPTHRANNTDYGRPAAMSKASTRPSKLHPDDSISNVSYQPRRRDHEPETRDCPRVPVIDKRTQYDSYHDYPPTLSSICSSRSTHREPERQHPPSITHAHALNPFEPIPTYTNTPAPQTAMKSSLKSKCKSRTRLPSLSPSRTVTHEHGRNPFDYAETHTWRPAETNERHRSEAAPTHHPASSRRQSETPTYRTSRHSPIPILRSAPAHGGPPLRPRLSTPPTVRNFQPSSHGGAGGSSGFSGQFYERGGSGWNTTTGAGSGSEDEFEYM